MSNIPQSDKPWSFALHPCKPLAANTFQLVVEAADLRTILGKLRFSTGAIQFFQSIYYPMLVSHLGSGPNESDKLQTNTEAIPTVGLDYARCENKA